jgi:thiamine-monophosphate kinase
MTRKSDPTLAALGEWGFLHRLLPRLRRRAVGRFLVPPGDDAAVLSGGERPVLSIDGLTESTHFRSRWQSRVRALLGQPLGRVLAWKLLGSSLSDLAAMGDTDRRWAMIYLGAPPSTRFSFLQDLTAGVEDAARRHDCALAGGDTVRAAELTLVAAVGGRLKRRALLRSGGRPGLRLLLAGTVGDAAAGLSILEGRSRVSGADAAALARAFFDVRPQFEAGARLSRERGAVAALDVSDALSDCLNILCRDSRVGAEVDLDALPMSAPFRRHFSWETALTGGEDYALLFAVPPASARRLARLRGVTEIGALTPLPGRVRYRRAGRPVAVPRSFQHFP